MMDNNKVSVYHFKNYPNCSIELKEAKKEELYKINWIRKLNSVEQTGYFSLLFKYYLTKKKILILKAGQTDNIN